MLAVATLSGAGFPAYTSESMFDAYFSPPMFLASDAQRMAYFGVRGCLLVMPTAHCAGEPCAPRTLQHFAALEGESPRSAVLRHLRNAGITAFVADGISPHQEPDRLWEAQWAALEQAVHGGSIHALGELVVQEGNHRSLRIIDRHIALALATDTPLLVAAPEGLELRWQSALLERASAHAGLWRWTRTDASFARAALTRGEGVIATIGGPRFSMEAFLDLHRSLPASALQRLSIGSSRGRGLNPFALAACEMALDGYHEDLRMQGGMRRGVSVGT